MSVPPAKRAGSITAQSKHNAMRLSDSGPDWPTRKLGYFPVGWLDLKMLDWGHTVAIVRMFLVATASLLLVAAEFSQFVNSGTAVAGLFLARAATCLPTATWRNKPPILNPHPAGLRRRMCSGTRAP